MEKDLNSFASGKIRNEDMIGIYNWDKIGGGET